MIFLLWLSSEIIWWQCNTLFQLETVCDFKTHCTAQSLLALCSLTLLRGFFLQTVPVPRGVCRWCFAAATAAPGAAAWLSPAGAAGLYSYWHSPSTKEAKHRSTFIFFSCYFYHKPKLLYLTVSALSLYNYCGVFFFYLICRDHWLSCVLFTLLLCLSCTAYSKHYILHTHLNIRHIYVQMFHLFHYTSSVFLQRSLKIHLLPVLLHGTVWAGGRPLAARGLLVSPQTAASVL